MQVLPSNGQNLVLPICPVCNDTKFVKEETDYNGLIHDCSHSCSKCNVKWNGKRNLRYATRGCPKFYNPK